MHALARSILPIYTFSRPGADGEVRPLRFAGTGFLLSPGLFVTCAHCVPALPDGEVYGAGVPDADGGRTAYYLADIQADPSGADLATARIGLQGPSAYRLYADMSAQQCDVGTLGFPGTWFKTSSSGQRTFDQQERYFQGYITRSFYYEPPDGRKPIPSFEIDMPAPQGLSGAPLISTDPSNRGEIIGVIYGAHPPFGLQGEGGTTLPPLVFALAHYHETLMNLRGVATGDRPLRELLPKRPS